MLYYRDHELMTEPLLGDDTPMDTVDSSVEMDADLMAACCKNADTFDYRECCELDDDEIAQLHELLENDLANAEYPGLIADHKQTAQALKELVCLWMYTTLHQDLSFVFVVAYQFYLFLVNSAIVG